MKRVFMSFLILFPAALLASYNVIYNTQNGDVLGYGYSAFEGDVSSPTVGLIQVDDKNPAFVNPGEGGEFMRVSTMTLTLALKSDAEIRAIKNRKLKNLLWRQSKSLQQRFQEDLQSIQNGFQIDDDTTAIRNQIIQLRQQYLSLP